MPHTTRALAAIARRRAPEAHRHVVIIGSGAAAVMAAHHLFAAVAAGAAPLRVTVVGRDPRVGPGLAYRTADPLHTVNNYAGRLSAVQHDPDHLLRWCAADGAPITNQTFLPRATYGRYLRETFEAIDVPPGSALGHRQGVVVDLLEQPDGRLRIRLNDDTLDADDVVLALGNPPPAVPTGPLSLWCSGSSYVPDPWRLDVDRIGRPRRVLLVGTGHTMADLAATLHAAHPAAELTAVSRRGLLPVAHRPGSARPHDLFHPGHGSLDEVEASVSARIAEVRDYGSDWRDVIDAVRGYANDLWRGWTGEDQQRFVAERARDWEILRHRLPPELAAHLARLRTDGVLRVLPSPSLSDDESFDLVVNCSGPAPVPALGWNPLVDALRRRGDLVPHRLGLGLDLDEDARPRRSDGTVWQRVRVLGAARRGLEWEVAAVPDLRAQASRLAEALTASAARGASGATA